MKIKALVPWFGSKRTLAPEIVRELGEHSAYWEPFCGSMAVLLAKPRRGHETVNDLHGDLVNMARVIQDSTLGPALYRRLRRVVLHESLLDEVKMSNSDDRVDRAFAFFVASWLARNGTAGTSDYNAHLCVRWTPSGGHGGMRFQHVVQSIPVFRQRLRDVLILERDGFDVIEKIDDVERVAIYVDPPYLVKGAKYVHDFEASDHDRLSALLARFTRARVVVSYYDHPRLAELYPSSRWTKRTIEVSKAMAHQGARGRNDTRATECLLINGPSYVESSGLF